MKRIARRALCILLLSALLALPALAELRRGDTGEDVYDLQQILFESGWLFELPDGIFGRNTEEAVRNYQGYARLPQTGVADDETIARMITDWEVLTGNTYWRDDPSAIEGDPPVHCIVIDQVDQIDVQYCGAHQDLLATVTALIEDGNAAQACALWEEDITQRYNDWMKYVDPQERLSVATARAAFFASVRQERAALETVYGDPETVDLQIEALLRDQAARVCQMVGEVEPE